MCAGKNNDKTKRTFLFPLFAPAKPMTLKFSDFRFIFTYCFVKN